MQSIGCSVQRAACSVQRAACSVQRVCRCLNWCVGTYYTCVRLRAERAHPADFASRNDTYRFKQREAIRQRLHVLTEDTTRFVGSHPCTFCVYISLGVNIGKF